MSLLDSSAAGLVDSVRAACYSALDSLERERTAAVDSLENTLARSGGALNKARSAYASAVAAYRDAFSGMLRFRSFGGNPIFSEEDADVATSVLLEEVADRFYKGKAFSLETEAEVRRFIRGRLVEAERRVRRQRNAVISARRSQTGATRAREELDAMYASARAQLVEAGNASIRQGLDGRVVVRTEVDSTGGYRFGAVAVGRYLLYTPDALPRGWLIPVRLSGHRRQDLVEDRRSSILIEAASEGRSQAEKTQG